MGKHKLIGVITSFPESIHAKRVLEGIFAQCQKYDYDVAVFTSMTNVCSSHADYLTGELNIYELPNFDMLDGIIVDTIPITEDGVIRVAEHINERLDKEYNGPVAVLNVPIGNYHTVVNNDSTIFREITEHVLSVHNITDIYFLTGQKGYSIAEERTEIFRQVMNEHGITVTDDMIFYGDFWYTSGKELADKIVSGEVRRPRAIICASDHMAIGLVNRLNEGGIRVPEDIIVTGFEATQEAALNEIPITSFESNAAKTAADAVDYIRGIIDPDAEIIPYDAEKSGHIHPAMSCGCSPDIAHSFRMFKEAFYYTYRDFSEPALSNIDIGQLMEGYVAEHFSGSSDPQDCLKNIYMFTYMNSPYRNFYLCLLENWLDTEKTIIKGYPEKMKICVHTAQQLGTGFYDEDKAITFDAKDMLPYLRDERPEPSVFYFMPVHFMGKTYGYAVLERSFEKGTINLVHRNWLRFVNTALEMVQAKNKLMMMSVRDEMTGAYNRRGMRMKIDELIERTADDDIVYAFVIDMDGLKYINDTFGHNDGDLGIKTICTAATAIMKPDEICVRAGGDEFYILGSGKVSEEQLMKRTDEFTEKLKELNDSANKPYTISASIGFAYSGKENLHINSIINAADEKMYRNKIERKKQRI